MLSPCSRIVPQDFIRQQIEIADWHLAAWESCYIHRTQCDTAASESNGLMYKNVYRDWRWK